MWDSYATLYRFLYWFWEEKNPTVLQSRYDLPWENSRRFATPPLVSLRNDVWASERKLHTYDASLPRCGLKQISLAARQIRSTLDIWVATRHQYRVCARLARKPIGVLLEQIMTWNFTFPILTYNKLLCFNFRQKEKDSLVNYYMLGLWGVEKQCTILLLY